MVFSAPTRIGRLLRRTAVLLPLLLAAPQPASAQIFSWFDASGSLVVSNVAPGTNMGIASFEVPDANGIRATRYAAPEQSSSFDELITRYASNNGVRRDLVRAVIQVESAFNPAALSNKGAMGLMQLMPATARQLGVRNAFDPVENIRGGVAYLRQLLDRYSGDERLALAAYNAGPGAVDRNGQTVPPYRETRDYVSRVKHAAGNVDAATPQAAPSEPRTRIYRVVEVVNGEEVVTYTDHDPNKAVGDWR